MEKNNNVLWFTIGIFILFGIIIGAAILLSNNNDSKSFNADDETFTINDNEPDIDRELESKDTVLNYYGKSYLEIEKFLGKKVDAIESNGNVEVQFGENTTWFLFPTSIYNDYQNLNKDRLFEAEVNNKNFNNIGMNMMLESFLPDYSEPTITQAKLSQVFANFICLQETATCNAIYGEYQVSIKLDMPEDALKDIKMSKYVNFGK